MIRSQVGSCFIGIAQGRTWLGFRRNYSQLGAFTGSNQLMLPRSQYSSTSVTFGLPDRSPLGAISLTSCGTESKQAFIQHRINARVFRL